MDNIYTIDTQNNDTLVFEPNTRKGKYLKNIDVWIYKIGSIINTSANPSVRLYKLYGNWVDTPIFI